MGNRPCKPSTELTTQEVNMLSTLTRTPAAMVNEWHRHFLTVAPNGAMTRKQFADVYQQKYPGINVDKLSRLIFDHFDTDDSRYLSFSEFYVPNAMLSQTRVDPKEKLRTIFNIYDTNDDGKISIKELTKMVGFLMTLNNTPTAGDPSKALVQQMMSRLDCNSDRSIEEVEFLDAASAIPEFMGLLNFDIAVRL